MKNVKFILAIALIALMVAVSVAADPIGKVYISEEDTDGVAISINAQYSDAVIGTLYAKVTYDNTILVPCAEEDFTDILADPETDVDDFVVAYYASKKLNYVNAADTTYEVNGNKTTIEMNFYTQTVKDTSDIDIVTMWFAFAAGKSKADLVDGTFSVDAIYFGDSNKVNWANNYDEVPNPVAFTFTNEVVSAADESPVVMKEDVDFRVDTPTTSGIRFKAAFKTDLKATATEYGYIATVESPKNNLPAGYELTMDLVDAGKAAKGVAFDGAGKDIFYAVDGEDTVVTAAILGTPMTKEALQYIIAVRAYYVEGGATFYAAETQKSSPYNAAKAVKAAGGEAYTANKDYIDNVIAIVDDAGSTTAILLDISALFD